MPTGYQAFGRQLRGGLAPPLLALHRPATLCARGPELLPPSSPMCDWLPGRHSNPDSAETPLPFRHLANHIGQQFTRAKPRGRPPNRGSKNRCETRGRRLLDPAPLDMRPIRLPTSSLMSPQRETASGTCNRT